MSREGLLSTRVWEARQSKWGEVVVRAKNGILYRATIRRNAYDDQCVLLVEMWVIGRGWEEVLTRHLYELPDVARLSYINKTGTWEEPIILGCYRLLTETNTLFSGLDFAFLQPGKEIVHV